MVNNLNRQTLQTVNDNCNNSSKGSSRRLKNKNMFLVNNNPLLFYFNYAKKSQLIDKIYVSTDNKEIEKYALKQNIGVIKRPESLEEKP